MGNGLLHGNVRLEWTAEGGRRGRVALTAASERLLLQLSNVGSQAGQLGFLADEEALVAQTSVIHLLLKTNDVSSQSLRLRQSCMQMG